MATDIIGSGRGQQTLAFTTSDLNFEINHQSQKAGIKAELLPDPVPRGDQKVIIATREEVDHAIKIAQAIELDASGKV